MPVPQFNCYYPSEDAMDGQQRDFYKDVESSLRKNEYIDVQGNISYVFVYIYKLLSQWNRGGFEELSEFLIYISELYKQEDKLHSYCLHWAYDCLLGLKKYEDFLDKTEPKQAFGTYTHQSNLRLNIQKHIGLEVNQIDVLLMAGGRKNKFIASNEALYKDKIMIALQEYSEKEGGWFSIFYKLGSGIDPKYQHTLFAGAPLFNIPKLDFNTYCFYATHDHGFGLVNKFRDLSKEAENKARVELGVPKIGEGWVSETSLFRIIESEFSMTLVIQHGRPSWLGRQHFDIWIPHWKVAIEYQGRQHFEPVEFFGGAESFEKTVERDKKKLDLAKRHGVKLFIVTEDDNPSELIASIYEVTKKRKFAFVMPNKTFQPTSG